MAIPLTMTAPGATYQARRAKLAAALSRPLVLFSGHAPARNYPANPHRFRPASSYSYFGGPPIENAALVVEPGSDGQSGCTLLRPPMGLDEALWLGALTKDEELAAAAGLPVGAIRDADTLRHIVDGRDAKAIVPPFVDTIRWSAELGLAAPTEAEQLAIIELRLFKDEHELKALRRAAQISIEAHRAAMGVTKPGATEHDVASAFVAALTRHGCDVSFNPIVTVCGEVLHGHAVGHRLEPGALLLLDGGAEEPSGYAGDITRTYPVGGEWSDVQRQLYETVRRAMNDAIAACVPGARYRDVHDLAARVVCEGLVEADLLRGDPAKLVERTAHALFFPHGVGHLLGMDVHDMEDFGDLAGYAPGRTRRPEFGNAYLRLDRDLAPGMTVTIEPGIYLVPAIWSAEKLVEPLRDVVNREKVDKLLNAGFGGIRIEQNIRVRDAGGPEVLTADLPTDPDEVATLVGTG